MAKDFVKLSEVTVLEEVTDSASVLVEVDGEIYRAPKTEVGGSKGAYSVVIGATGYMSEVITGPANANIHFEVGSYDEIIEKLNAGEALDVCLKGTYMYGDVEASWIWQCMNVDYVPNQWLGFMFFIGNNSLELWLDSEGNWDLPSASQPV